MISIRQLRDDLLARPGQTQSEICRERCSDCESSCIACAEACLGEADVTGPSSCVRWSLDCAAVCAATGVLLSRSFPANGRMLRAMLEACLRACALCATACRSQPERDHCRRCAEACVACEDACRALLRLTPHELAGFWIERRSARPQH